MTILSPYHFTVDGTPLATYAHALESIQGTDVLAAARSKPLEIPYQHGATVDFDTWRKPKTYPLKIWVAGTDPDGQVTDPAGEAGHIRSNLDALLEIFGKKPGPITVTRDIPDGAGGTITLTAQAHVTRQIVAGGSRGLRILIVDLLLPHPFWHEPQVDVTGQTAASFTITPGGTAVVPDMQIDFAAGASGPRLTHDDTGAWIEIVGTVPTGGVRVDCGARTVTKLADGSFYDANFLYNRDHPEWIELAPTLNNLTLSAGTIDYHYYPHRH